MTKITLCCCTCGKQKEALVAKPPMFAFELYKIAEEAGWHAILDMNYGRALCFCSEECKKKQFTKAGTIRKRLIHWPKNSDTGKAK